MSECISDTKSQVKAPDDLLAVFEYAVVLGSLVWPGGKTNVSAVLRAAGIEPTISTAQFEES